MDHGTLRERDRFFVRRAFLVDFGVVDRDVIDKRLCLHTQWSSVIPIDISVLSGFVTQFWTLIQ